MSTIRVDNFGPSAGGTTYSARGIAKAWANINGTGTIAARDSENVSSLTDNGTGEYQYNFTSAMANSNFTPTTSAFRDSNVYTGIYFGFNNTAYTKTSHYTRGTSTAADTDSVYVVVHGDLA